LSRTLVLLRETIAPRGRAPIFVLAAGTSDIPVAEEAAVTATLLGNEVERVYDVGVAGIHRLFTEIERISRAGVIIVVAGMEGALPSVVGGLVDRPVVAVPTSVGYGASFGGIAALLAMLNACAGDHRGEHRQRFGPHLPPRLMNRKGQHAHRVVRLLQRRVGEHDPRRADRARVPVRVIEEAGRGRRRALHAR
jgi:hypothetical protein